MSLNNSQSENNLPYEDIGIVFISPIIGMPDSLLDTFNPLVKQGMKIEGVDIWEGQNFKKSLWSILRLTILPGSNQKRINFANKYDEQVLFEKISEKIEKLKSKGIKKIILGGMSGGFIFASRLAQIPIEDELAKYASVTQSLLKGVFGVSPLIFYPPDVKSSSANLKLIPSSIPVLLIWGDADTIIPKGTIEHAKDLSKDLKNLKSLIVRGSDVGLKDGTIRHQFFGGVDFVKPLKNVFWNKKAEDIVLENIQDFINKASSGGQQQ